MTGATYAGPLTWDRAFTVHCYLRVNVNQHCADHPNCTAFDAHASSTEAPPGTHTASMSPTAITYTSGEFDQDYMCTAVSYAGGTVYWHPTEDPDGIPQSGDEVAGHWTTDVNKPCSAATQISTGPIIRLLNETVFEPLDALVICPLLKILDELFDSTGIPELRDAIDDEGDVFAGGKTENEMVWDCPVYVGDGDAAAGGIFDGD